MKRKNEKKLTPDRKTHVLQPMELSPPSDLDQSTEFFVVSDDTDSDNPSRNQSQEDTSLSYALQRMRLDQESELEKVVDWNQLEVVPNPNNENCPPPVVPQLTTERSPHPTQSPPAPFSVETETPLQSSDQKALDFVSDSSAEITGQQTAHQSSEPFTFQFDQSRANVNQSQSHFRFTGQTPLTEGLQSASFGPQLPNQPDASSMELDQSRASIINQPEPLTTYPRSVTTTPGRSQVPVPFLVLSQLHKADIPTRDQASGHQRRELRFNQSETLFSARGQFERDTSQRRSSQLGQALETSFSRHLDQSASNIPVYDEDKSCGVLQYYLNNPFDEGAMRNSRSRQSRSRIRTNLNRLREVRDRDRIRNICLNQSRDEVTDQEQASASGQSGDQSVDESILKSKRNRKF